MKATLIPDWVMPKTLALVWPRKLPDYRDSLIPFYTEFIRLLIDHSPGYPITIFHRYGCLTQLNLLFGEENINPVEASRVQDIWIRDYAPFWKEDGDEIIPVKGLYKPHYEGPVYQKYSLEDELLGSGIGGAALERIAITGIPVKMDGGTFVHNGSGLGICTGRVLTDNSDFEEELVREALKKRLGLRELVVIPVETGDFTGHADGLVRFINEDTALVSAYAYKWKEYGPFIQLIEYKEAIQELADLRSYLEQHIPHVYPLTNGIPIENSYSAVGNYMNFLRLGEKVFVPQYGRRNQDQSALSFFEDMGFKRENIIAAPNCMELAELGGVLNCITAHVY